MEIIIFKIKRFKKKFKSKVISLKVFHLRISYKAVLLRTQNVL